MSATMRQAIAIQRGILRARGTGGLIVVHRPGCAYGWYEPCDCRPRKLLVRA